MRRIILLGLSAFPVLGYSQTEEEEPKEKQIEEVVFQKKSQIHRPYQCADFLGGGEGGGYDFGGRGNPAENPAFGKFKCGAELAVYGARWEF